MNVILYKLLSSFVELGGIRVCYGGGGDWGWGGGTAIIEKNGYRLK